jgi:transcriptional regulator with GAF, ATPase, and Fis domain
MRPCTDFQRTNYFPVIASAVFRATDQMLAKVTEGLKEPGSELCIHLSPGTPAMTAVWVLLGKSRYPATFYQSFKGRVWRTDIPFDLAVDYVPELLRAPDTSLQYLATKSPSEIAGFEQIAGDSKAIRLAVGRARRAAIRGVPVLLLGESGTGKEMFARAIHDASLRRGKPFIPINCAAISGALLESELFGHRKGAFTGADRDRKGAFELADGGTLFLDEVGECDPAMQVKLLRVLQPPPEAGPCHRTFQRVGETEELTSDVRVIAATNRDLLKAVRDSNFREDLYFRLAVITIKLPPLRERRTDIPKIAERLLAQINAHFRAEEPGYRDKSISESSISFLRRYDWSGNVRQLHNVLLQAAVMTESNVLEKQDLVDSLADLPQVTRELDDVLEYPIGNGFCLDELLKRIQQHYLRRAMNESRGVKAQAARLLGMSNYQRLDAQLQRLKVDGDWS